MRLKYFFGFILIVFGALLLLQNLGVIPNVSLWDYLLPIMLLGIGIVDAINNKRMNAGDIILIIFGGGLLADRLGLLLGVNLWSIIIPLIIIYFGLRLLTHNNHIKIVNHTKIHNTYSPVNAVAVFSTSENKYTVNDFYNGDCTAVFGSCIADLSDVRTTATQCFLEVNAVFGSVEIIVPVDWAVDSKIAPIFGGCENRAYSPTDAKTTLVITGNAVFGKIEVKSKPIND